MSQRKPRAVFSKVEVGLRVHVIRVSAREGDTAGPGLNPRDPERRVEYVPSRHPKQQFVVDVHTKLPVRRSQEFEGRLVRDVEVGKDLMLPAGIFVRFSATDVDFTRAAHETTFAVVRIATLKDGTVVLIDAAGKAIGISRQTGPNFSHALRTDRPYHVYSVDLSNAAGEGIHVTDVADLGADATAF